jgi:hypothetical protein
MESTWPLGLQLRPLGGNLGNQHSTEREESNMPKVLIVLVFAAGLITGIILYISSKSLQAADSACAIPKNYGSVKALGPIYLVFEGADGTIRLVSDACQTVRVITRN